MEIPMLTNLWAAEMRVGSVPRGLVCDCPCRACSKDNDWQENQLHIDHQDTSLPGWIKLCHLIDMAAADGREEFSPRREMSPKEWQDIVTLPPSIAKLKRVKRFILYGNNLSRIPPEIGEMESLEYFTPYTSYRLHWFPYEMTRCTKLNDSSVSTRAIYGNFKNRMNFPKLEEGYVDDEMLPGRCSVCRGPFGNDGQGGSTVHRVWVSQRVATDVLPLLVHACSENCVQSLPTRAAKGYLATPHTGGADLEQPESSLAFGRRRYCAFSASS